MFKFMSNSLVSYRLVMH